LIDPFADICDVDVCKLVTVAVNNTIDQHFWLNLKF